MRIATRVMLAAGVALAVLAANAGAGPPGTWTQITPAHNGTAANLGLARAKDGALHVFWAGPNRNPLTAICDTPVSAGGAVGAAKPVVSGWDTVHTPAAVTAPDGSIHLVVSGQKVPANTDPNSGLNEIVGPGSWQLAAHAFGNFSISVASNANVRSAVLKNGQLVSVWATAAKMLFQVGVDPSTEPQNISGNDTIGAAEIAVDQASGDAIVAYHGVSSGTDFLRRVVPSLGPPETIPGDKADPPPIAARAGGGVFTAYTSDGATVRLLRFGGKPRVVPVPKGAQIGPVGLAAGPDGRLWIYYGNTTTTWVTRTSRSTSGFEPVQALKSPPGAVQYFRLEGEGSAGPLDLFADITVDGQAKDGSYHQQVQPALSLRASKKAVKGGVRVTVRVTDAGDPVAGAKVSGLPGGAKATDATGSVAVTVRKGGKLSLTATKPGYVGAKGTLAL
jgi:hypothetical protein